MYGMSDHTAVLTLSLSLTEIRPTNNILFNPFVKSGRDYTNDGNIKNSIYLKPTEIKSGENF